MKLTSLEKKAISILRKLDGNQRERVIRDLRQQATANRITMKVAGLNKLRTTSDTKVTKAFGEIPRPYWRGTKLKCSAFALLPLLI